MKHHLVAALLAGALALVLSAAQAGTVSCTPTLLTKVTTDSNSVGRWGAYMCGKDPHIFACRNKACTDAVLNAVSYLATMGSDVKAVNAALVKYKAGGRCDPAVKAVWWPSRYKLVRDLGMTTQEVNALCPTP